jgi:hypothetical protein
MIISFDFDFTLSTEKMQNLAKFYLQKKFEVWVVTSRYNQTGGWAITYDNDDLYEVTNKLGISSNRVIFTQGNPKYLFFQNHKKFDLHYDDCEYEIQDINKYTDTIGILIPDN